MLPSRRSIRLPNYDYSQPGAYFITLVTYQREPLFGNIRQDGQMDLSQYGKVVLHDWQDMIQNFPIELDEFVIMPDHFHAILLIKEPRYPLGTIVNQFKSRVTRHVRRAMGDNDYLVWQRNYYEHIIRDEEDLSTVRRYIQGNPFNWIEDVP